MHFSPSFNARCYFLVCFVLLAIYFLLFFSMWKAFFPLIAFSLTCIVCLDPLKLCLSETCLVIVVTNELCASHSPWLVVLGPCLAGTGTIALDPTFGSFTSLEPVSYSVNQFLWCLDYLDCKGFFGCLRVWTCRCTTSYVFAGPACLRCLGFSHASSNAFYGLIYSQAPPCVLPTFLMVVSNKINDIGNTWPLCTFKLHLLYFGLLSDYI